MGYLILTDFNMQDIQNIINAPVYYQIHQKVIKFMPEFLVCFYCFGAKEHIQMYQSVFKFGDHRLLYLQIIYFFFNNINSTLSPKNLMEMPQSQLKNTINSILAEHLPQYLPGKIEMKGLCGTTNQTFKITLQNYSPVVFRKLSPIIDRYIEGNIIKQLSACGAAPKCYYTSLKYRLEEYIENGHHAQPAQILENQQILKAIVQKVSDFHTVKLSNGISRQNMIMKIFTNENKQKYQQSTPHQSYNQKEFFELKESLLKQFQVMKQWLKTNFSQINEECKIGFCHNDLNNLNIIIKNVKNEEGQQIGKQAILIDFQYASYNFIAYDLANLLNETCFEYSGPYPGFKCTKRLTDEKIQKVCSFYKNVYPSLHKDINKMLVLVNFYWALWSLLIKPTQSNPTFCPLKHGLARFDLYNFYKSKCIQ